MSFALGTAYVSPTLAILSGEKNYKAVLIEGNAKRVLDLERNFPSENVIKINRFMDFVGPNSLEGIFAETDIPKDFDFISIDVDGVDYHILDSLVEYRPKVVCVEFNPSIPNQIDYVQPRDMSIKHGNSAKALVRLGLEKGYALVASTRCNLILVDDNYLSHLGEKRKSLDELNVENVAPVCLFCGYDGTVLSNEEYFVLGWHGIPVPISDKFQVIPKFMRKFPGDYGVFRKLFLAIWICLYVPKEVMKRRKDAYLALKRLFGFE